VASISGAFRGIPVFNSTQNFGDGVTGSPAIADQRTQGVTQIDQLPLQPALAAPWVIDGWSIAFDLWLFQNAPTAPIFGRLGSILGGLCHAAQIPAPLVGGGARPVLPLPPNLGLLTQLWDGVADPCPPIVPAWAQAFPGAPTTISTTYPLPQPMVLEPGDSLSIGMWLTPSVSQNVQLCVFNAHWTVSYTEQPPFAFPWGQ